MKRVFAAALVILLLLPLTLTPGVRAAERDYGQVQILIGDLETDCIAEKILSEIDTAGLGDKAKIQKVYDWIITHCYRNEPDYDDYNPDYGVTDAEISAYSYQCAELMAQGRATVRKELTEVYTDYSMAGYENGDYEPYYYDTNFYITYFGNTMMYTRVGNCAHFSSLLAILLGHLGYDCRLIPGYFKNRDGSVVLHKWNCVLVNGTYYWLDVRIDNATYARTGKVAHDYFYISSDDTWAKSHIWVKGYTDLLKSHTADIMNMYRNSPVHSHEYEVLRESPASCVSDGYLLRECGVCGALLYDYYPSNGEHSFTTVSYEGEQTCTSSATELLRCDYCGLETTVEHPALGHEWALTEYLTDLVIDDLHGCSGLYTCGRCGETKEAPLCAAEIFTDMPPEGNWAHAPIDWAYFRGITSGKTPNTFAPKDTVTRAQALTFLYISLDRPGYEIEENPFTDVKEGKYYYDAVLWAVENGITSGTSETSFSPHQDCTRAQILTFIWIAAGRPEPITTENPFTDVKEGKYYYKPVLWAVENGVTSGVGEGLFGPGLTCTRAQTVAFLYKTKDLIEP